MATVKKNDKAGNLANIKDDGKGKDLPAHAAQEKFTKKLKDADIFLMKCPSCGGVHFRHAGYLETMLPFVSPKTGDSLAVDSVPVKICVKCKTAHIVSGDKIIDVTEHIDLQAWEKTEKEAQKATGPGGNC